MVAKFVESINLTSHAQNIWKKKKKIIANNETLLTSETPFVRLRINKILLIFCLLFLLWLS